MRKLIYYIGTTIDGFIAGPDGQVDFFPLEPDVIAMITAEFPETVPSHLRPALGLSDAPNLRFDTLVMGRGTYEPGLAEGITSPYSHLRQYVFSRTLSSSDPQVEIVSGDPVDFVRELKQEDGLDIWLCGGGDLARQLLPEIDEMVVKRYPVLSGAGISMFAGPFNPVSFAVASTRTFESGAAMITYTRT